MKKKLIVIAGPTGVGKTDLSIKLAKRIGGKIISADSMQVYKKMNIGSAKITREEMDGIEHYLIDELEPTEDFNVCRFKSMADSALKEIYDCGSVPIMVGGTGFYIQSVLYDIDFDRMDEGGEIRGRLERQAADEGAQSLWERLLGVDPESAQAIHPNNVKRVIRALEFFELTGKRISEHNERERAKESPFDYRYYVLTDERSRLYERIDARVDSG